jgi:guanosine-3',5'-bis(diphosphate) 3'-pyrophosphohydrolase
MSETPVELPLRAATFAAEKHKSQLRKNSGATPYINHPLAVADLLAREGRADDCELALACDLRVMDRDDTHRGDPPRHHRGHRGYA